MGLLRLHTWIISTVKYLLLPADGLRIASSFAETDARSNIKTEHSKNSSAQFALSRLAMENRIKRAAVALKDFKGLLYIFFSDNSAQK